MKTVFSGAEVFDGTGALPAVADIVIEGGRIIEVGRGLDGDEVIDLSGKSIIPGLFDCHVHVTITHLDLWKAVQVPFSYPYFQTVLNLAATLRAGVTTIRDAAGADLGVKQAVADGLIPGPRMQIAISLLSQTGGHADDWFPSGCHVPLVRTTPGIPEMIVDGPEEMRRKVREVIRAGADVIKIASTGGVLSPRDDPRHAHFRDDELSMLIEEANAAGRWVMSHSIGTEGIKNAVKAGVRSIEHGIYLDDEAIDLMLQRGTFLVPTLNAPRGVIAAAEAGAAIAETSMNKARELIDIHQASFTRAVEAGVRIAMGTDSGVIPHGRNLEELPAMVGGGMKPEEVLRSATAVSAELMGLDKELGTLEPGKRADFVVVEGNPLEFDKLSDRIRAVYKEGTKAIDATVTQ